MNKETCVGVLEIHKLQGSQVGRKFHLSLTQIQDSKEIHNEKQSTIDQDLRAEDDQTKRKIGYVFILKSVGQGVPLICYPSSI
jgi:hypothetical protein